MGSLRCEIEMDEELEYQVSCRPMRESHRPPQTRSARYEKQSSPASARGGIHRRGTSSNRKFAM